MTDCRIYAASLASYNAGRLHGAWIDIDESSDVESVNEAIQAMLATCPEHGEEYAIHDHEGFDGMRVGEWPAIADLVAFGAAKAEHGDAFLAAMANFGDVTEAVKAVTEYYVGAHKSLADYIEDSHADCGTDIPETFRNYIDWEAMARDAEMNGDIWSHEIDGMVHVFYNR